MGKSCPQISVAGLAGLSFWDVSVGGKSPLWPVLAGSFLPGPPWRFPMVVYRTTAQSVVLR